MSDPLRDGTVPYEGIPLSAAANISARQMPNLDPALPTSPARASSFGRARSHSAPDCFERQSLDNDPGLLFIPAKTPSLPRSLSPTSVPNGPAGTPQFAMPYTYTGHSSIMRQSLDNDRLLPSGPARTPRYSPSRSVHDYDRALPSGPTGTPHYSHSRSVRDYDPALPGSAWGESLSFAAADTFLRQRRESSLSQDKTAFASCGHGAPSTPRGCLIPLRSETAGSPLAMVPKEVTDEEKTAEANAQLAEICIAEGLHTKP